jgi:hypothetical protein
VNLHASFSTDAIGAAAVEVHGRGEFADSSQPAGDRSFDLVESIGVSVDLDEPMAIASDSGRSEMRESVLELERGMTIGRFDLNMKTSRSHRVPSAFADVGEAGVSELQ